MTETLRPFRAQLDERKPPTRALGGIPLSVLREAYQHAHDTRQANADQPETVRDYWPTCVEMVLVDHEAARMRMWLVRAKPRNVGGQTVFEYLQLHDAGLVPPGVGLWSTRSLCKQASKFTSDHPSRPLPKGLRPAATT